MTEGPVASLDAALAHAARLLEPEPALAERQAREILNAAPSDPRALMILGASLRRRGDAAGARAVLEPLADAQPRSPHTHLELGLALAALGEGRAALAPLRHAVALKRDLPQAWRAIGDQLFIEGDAAGADAAYSELLRAGVSDPALRQAAEALCDDRLDVAEQLLRARLKAEPTDVAAMRMLAEAGTRLGRLADAEALLTRCLELSPSFDGARYNLAIVLHRQQKGAEAVAHLERLRQVDPQEPSYRNLLAASLALTGEYARAIEIYRELLDQFPRQARMWLSYGHVLRTGGRRSDSVAAYKRAIDLEPGLGDAYWSLANLKTEPFTDDEVAAMEAQLGRQEISAEDRLHLHFALGKAREDAGQFDAAFAHYADGARLRRASHPYQADETESAVARSKALYSKTFFAHRAGWGTDSAAPVFIVGLPRSGSTLIEQILASHSAVEGTMELPEIGAIAGEFKRATRRRRDTPYPDVIGELSAAEIEEYGRNYLDRTQVYRKLGRTRFIDKMPNNFMHIGFIHLILPNAKIIDARRHPMAACFSAFKQHFARGHAFSYDLTDAGRYYRDYVELMAHFDVALPGRVHRVIYEDMVEDIEAETRRLLDYCGLPFEPGCLRFYENERAVRTASSEQVRRPIFRDGLEQWRNYEPWLDPLAQALGPALSRWRD
ncbi:MAG TPA: sulfotransferase [Caulobacteraceae bacterium]